MQRKHQKAELIVNLLGWKRTTANIFVLDCIISNAVIVRLWIYDRLKWDEQTLREQKKFVQRILS